MQALFWRPAGLHRHISCDDAWLLTRDGAWRLTSTITGEIFSYDDFSELMQDVRGYGMVYMFQALGAGL